jgi:hypothetical protein
VALARGVKPGDVLITRGAAVARAELLKRKSAGE